jgi:hypothetical protein
MDLQEVGLGGYRWMRQCADKRGGACSAYGGRGEVCTRFCGKT